MPSRSTTPAQRPGLKALKKRWHLLRKACGPDRLITFARSVTTPDEQITTLPLSEAGPDMADMRTVVLIGSRHTRQIGRFVYTPRSIPV